jgi:hypothetical protein
MTLIELLEIDLRSHPDRLNAEQSLAEIEGKMKEGWHGFRSGNTFIMNKPDKNGYLEFHCYNAEPGKQLAKNVVEFFGEARDSGFKVAWTPYKNPKINKLFKSFIDDDCLDIVEIQDGYLAKVRL